MLMFMRSLWVVVGLCGLHIVLWNGLAVASQESGCMSLTSRQKAVLDTKWQSDLDSVSRFVVRRAFGKTAQQSKRAPAKQVRAVMALLAMFNEAEVLPPESDPRANQLIRSLIQFQSVFIKSHEPAIQKFFASALLSRWGQQGTLVRDSFYEQGWTSESLEALVEYSQTHAMWQDEQMKTVFHQYDLNTADWALVQDIFNAARQQFMAERHNMHEVFARIAHGTF